MPFVSRSSWIFMSFRTSMALQGHSMPIVAGMHANPCLKDARVIKAACVLQLLL